MVSVAERTPSSTSTDESPLVTASPTKPSTLSADEMNELFDLFLDDKISDDAVFEVPQNFDEIVEEAFERLSQDAERKVAGIVKRIINMEEEQAVSGD